MSDEPYYPRLEAANYQAAVDNWQREKANRIALEASLAASTQRNKELEEENARLKAAIVKAVEMMRVALFLDGPGTVRNHLRAALAGEPEEG